MAKGGARTMTSHNNILGHDPPHLLCSFLSLTIPLPLPPPPQPYNTIWPLHLPQCLSHGPPLRRPITTLHHVFFTRTQYTILLLFCPSSVHILNIHHHHHTRSPFSFVSQNVVELPYISPHPHYSSPSPHSVSILLCLPKSTTSSTPNPASI